MGDQHRIVRVSEELLAARRRASELLLPRARPARPAPAPYARATRPEENLVGIGVGEKITRGRGTGVAALRLYVEKKLLPAAVPPDHLLPREIEGFPTDVIEAGRFTALPARRAPGAPARKTPKDDPRARHRPARPGCSIGFRFPPPGEYVMAGTFGALVLDGDRPCILSNNHVLADENRLPEGSPIYQPGLLDGGDPARDQVAELFRSIPLRLEEMNRVDAALARLLDPALASPEFLAPIGRLRSDRAIEPAVGMEVEKVGRTTGPTRGEVFDAQADLRIAYDTGVLFFEDQVLIRGSRGVFSDGGDSGSGIVDRKTGRLAALLFGGSPVFTAATPIARVFAELGVTLVARPVRPRPAAPRAT